MQKYFNNVIYEMFSVYIWKSSVNEFYNLCPIVIVYEIHI